MRYICDSDKKSISLCNFLNQRKDEQNENIEKLKLAFSNIRDPLNKSLFHQDRRQNQSFSESDLNSFVQDVNEVARSIDLNVQPVNVSEASIETDMQRIVDIWSRSK
jgi:hypothetical protein